MKIVILGSGAREHSICVAISKSRLLTKLYIIAGNAGIANVAEIVDILLSDFVAIKNFCLAKEIDLVFVGPEQPLVDGIVEFLEKFNIAVIGADSYCAQLESSKSFTKKICDIKNIPTAKYQGFTNEEDAIIYLAEENKYPQVIKADGLAAGKGVIIAADFADAKQAVKEIFAGKFGSMSKIIIEEFLIGIEASVFAIADGNSFKLLSNAGDHKRIGDGDVGLNTGGMGSYSPSPFVTKEIENQVIEEILKPTFSYLKEQGHNYKGIIFAGLMISKEQKAYLIEYNIRFGDPETQSILSRLETDFLEICKAVKEQKLADLEVKFSNKKAVTLVISSNGYPENYKKGGVINLDNIDKEKVTIFHAGTKVQNNQLIANGGRVLNLTAIEDSFAKARDAVYEQAEKIKWQDKYYRTDIAQKVV